MRAAAQWIGKRLGRRTPAARRHLRRVLRDTLGQRGIPLLLLGTGKFCFGIGFIAAPIVDPRGLELLTAIAPVHCWAWIWVICGTITFASAFLRIGRDRWGFVTALVPPVIWASAYGYAAATGTYSRGFYIFFWYMTSHVGMILWASGAIEPAAPESVRQGSERGPRT